MTRRPFSFFFFLFNLTCEQWTTETLRDQLRAKRAWTGRIYERHSGISSYSCCCLSFRIVSIDGRMTKETSHTRPWGDKRATVLGGSQKRQSSFESAAATCWALVSCPWQPCSLFHPSRSSNTFRAFKIFGRMHLFIILLFSREYSQTLLLLSRVAPVRSWWRSIAAITSREQNYIRSHFASISLWTRAS